ncbi:hypothetical protein EDC65_3527 [Stella humosa]|uniref:Acetyltransferase (GNAT) family protein n=1 Tax=Stella humosa TaxID=94 RepID=A0A3N1KZF9_9PROT|nr:hypothetical protein [Stella humosa]ROP84179.1 hypothetical protein EDC65_3527 [Stella humosa]BBK33691.1 hypothetical protein STHU_43250 [Stella humosa]
MIFDEVAYLQTLSHIGPAWRPTALPHAVLLRDIPGTALRDVLGPWPYATAPDPAGLPAALAEMRAAGVVSFTGMVRPGAGTDPADYAGEGTRMALLKPHFVIDPAAGPPAPSARTRRNVALGARHWSIDEAPDRAEAAGTADRLHRALQARRRMSAMTRMPPGHFAALLAIPGIHALVARAGTAIGAMIIAAREAEETHLLHFLVDEDAIATCPSYALMAHIGESWRHRGPVYMGGTPDGPDGPGVARFKARWASGTRPTFLLTAIVQDDIYRRLAGDDGDSGYFPAYRRPGATIGAPPP